VDFSEKHFAAGGFLLGGIEVYLITTIPSPTIATTPHAHIMALETCSTIIKKNKKIPCQPVLPSCPKQVYGTT